MAKSSKLDIAIAELSVLLKGVVSDISEIKNRLSIMDEQFARKEDLAKTETSIIELRNVIQDQEVNIAVSASQMKTWGIIGGIIITLLSAAISALQIRL